LTNFIKTGLLKYDIDRQSADNDPSSGLSPYLHFGHISAHEMVHRIWTEHNWTPNMAAIKATGSRVGWWNLPPHIEAFLDQIITWRDLGFVYCHHDPTYATYESLPEWAKKTMSEHLGDKREYIYTLEEFEKAQTHDPIWNAAQRQLIKEGRMHNYLRMLWAKKVLHWTQTPQDAVLILEELNNKYALDGRDPNSYSGIMWTLGRFDRAWTERPIFGKIRYMTSDSTKRKMKLTQYLKTYGPTSSV
jgi:deoxyribodipyrimidine photo-lyase